MRATTTRRRPCAAAALASALVATTAAPTAHAVIFYSTGDPTHNTTAPTGAYANSGWQWEGQWAGSYLGTAIAPQYFVTASHVGGSLGGTFTYNGVAYTTVPFPDGSPNKSIGGTDLLVWRVSGTFNSYAPLFDPSTDGSETGLTAVMIGRGTQRGAAIRLGNSPTGDLRGWQWGAIDGVQRWGTNIVTSVSPQTVGGTTAAALRLNFDANPADRSPASAADASGYSGPDEVIMSDKDSGGAVFVKTGTTWKLAGINWAVATGFAYTANSAQIGTGQAMFDYGGFYLANSPNKISDTYQDAPAYSLATAVSPHIADFAAALDGSPPVWNVDSGGDWGTSTNWWTNYDGTAPIPNGAGSQAIFGRVITAPRTISLIANKTVGTLTFDSTVSYTLAGTATLVLNSATGSAAVSVTAGTHTIAAPVQLGTNTTVTVTPDAGNSSKLWVTGNLTAGPGVTLTKAGTGPMEVTALRLAGVSVAGGTLRVTPNGTTAATSVVNSVSVATASGATLDLSDNDLVLDYSGATPANTIRQYLLSGRNGGAWNGSGIVSSTAAADPQHRTAIAVTEASALLGLSGAATATWSGQTVDATSLLLKYTWYGDANFDGKVTADDYALIDRGMAKGLTGWVNGDFNYDNVIDAGDYALIDRAFASQSGTLSPEFLADREAEFGADYVAALITSVPEPSLGLPLVAGAIPLLRRRRPRA